MSQQNAANLVPGAVLAALLGFGLAYVAAPAPAPAGLGPAKLTPIDSPSASPALADSKAGTQPDDPAAAADASPRHADTHVSPDPSVAEPNSIQPENAGVKTSTNHAKNVPPLGSVDINSADAATLAEIPSIGPAMAQRIVDFRQHLGRITSLEQLRLVEGFGPKRYEKVVPYLHL